MTNQEYIDKVNSRYKQGNSTEHTFRGDLQNLLESILPEVNVTNEPSRIACGAPDYILTKNGIPVGYIEAKDLNEDLNSKVHKEQFDRYKKSLDNLIITNYLEFQFFKDGKLTMVVHLGELKGKSVTSISDNFDSFNSIINDFSNVITQSIKSPKILASMMASKAKMLALVIEKALDQYDSEDINVVHETADITLYDQLQAFKNILIHEINNKEFSDIYAQTIAYGMFAARLHDPTLDTFSRQEAAELIPHSNPFLRRLFQYIAGYDLDRRIQWIVDALADIFRATDVAALLTNFGRATQQTDPIIHFYETFLSEYDPKLKKARGVWYTPEPVVNFIVKSVDQILQRDFELKDGIADTSKVKNKISVQGKKKDVEFHRVQILDPAVGTGTFLAEVIKQIHAKFDGQEGIWNSYVANHLIPRLNGFEILMASYAMAHLKLDLLLTETGYRPTRDQRLRVYLTNSLEEYHADSGTLFATWLSAEANEANLIKRDTPVMVVLGNPPYLGESKNKGEWIMNLMEDYKKEPGGLEKLQERNPKWLNDDYVKFLRYGQHFIEKNGSGVLAFINPHGFLDNPTFRGMRWSLLNTYDKIYSIDLHGNSKKEEVALDGSPDQNVFDIMQGVSINIFVKTGKKKNKTLGKFYHYDLLGKREAKYEFLNSNTVTSVKYKEIKCSPPMYYMMPTNFQLKDEYENGFALNELFVSNSMGITSGDDKEFISTNEALLKNKFNPNHVVPLEYRPFDRRFIEYDQDKLARARYQFMVSFLQPNIGIAMVRRSRSNEFLRPFIVTGIADKCILSTLDNANIFPLYVYSQEVDQIAIDKEYTRTSNFNTKILDKISNHLSMVFSLTKKNGTYTPEDLLSYIYCILYSKKFKNKFNDFLKLDFPRIPLPKDKSTFLTLSELGKKMQNLHSMKSSSISTVQTKFPVSGTELVDAIKYKSNRVYINNEQYFEGVQESTWNFEIGGYTPAQKWLKDKKGEKLTFEHIVHYQKILSILFESEQLIDQIDKVDFA